MMEEMMCKRIIAWLLVLAMVVSFVPPISVSAEEPEKQPVLTEQEPTVDQTGRIQDTTTVTSVLGGGEEVSTSEAPAGYEPESILEMEDLEEQDWFEHLDLGFSLMNLEEPGESSEEEETEEQYRNVLLIQEHQPWSKSANTDLLRKLLNEGYIDDYTVTTMSAAADLDFSGYMMIMIPSDQPQAVYNNYANYVSGKINDYVANGGILYFSVCDHGHAGGGLNVDLPGGVKRSHTTSNQNYIADASHPIVTGEYTDGVALTNSNLSGSYCSHESFVESTLPEGTHVILRATTGGAPTLVEYPYGSGYIVASGLTWEFYYASGTSGTGSFSPRSYDDVIVYALNQNRFDDSTMPVTNLHTNYVGSHTVELQWNPPRNGNVIGYRVYRDGELLADIGELNYTDFAPEADTTYTYQIIGYTAGNLEMEPGTITVTTKGIPVITRVYTNNEDYVGGQQSTIYAMVNSDAALDGAEGRFFYINGYENDIGGIVTDYTHNGSNAIYKVNWPLDGIADGTYEVGFELLDADGERAVATALITVDNSAPSAIVGLLAQADHEAIYLSWSIAAEYRVNTYRVYRRVLGTDSWTLLAEKKGNRNDTAYVDRTAQKDVIYEYAVTAVSPFGLESEYCESATAELVVDREIPVVTSLSPARNSVLKGEVSFAASATDNDQVAGITLYYKRAEEEEGIAFGSAQGTSVTARLNTAELEDGLILVYAVAVDATGNLSAGTPMYPYTIDNTGPAAVTDLVYTSNTSVITLSWRYEQDNDFDHFVVEQKNADGSFRQVAIERKTLGVNLTGLLPGTEYTYRVYVVDHVGNVSAYSEEITAVTKDDITAPVVTAISPAAGYRRADFNVVFTIKDDGLIESADIQVSRNRLNWETVATEIFAEPRTTENCTFTVLMEEYPEDGSLYIRAIPTDTAGNRAEENDAPYVEYILDRTAPIVPQNVTAEARGNANYILWTNDPNGETASYRVLRSATRDGEYQLIASGLAAISFYDRTAEADVLYWYQVQAVDIAGNISQGSEPVSCSWTASSDETAPQVLSVSPADSGLLGGASGTISVLAQDDRTLSRIVVVCRNEMTGQEQTLTMNGIGSYYLSSSVTPDLSSFRTGDRMAVQIVAYDANNNPSEAVACTYTVDKTAPAVTDLTARLNGSAVEITWSQGADSADLNGYYIYRSNGGGWTRIGTRGARVDGMYTFTDQLNSSGTYTYKVTAIDMIGNQAEFISNAVNYEKPVEQLLIADFVTDRQQQQGVEHLFDASESYCSNGSIVSYLFDFGDGTTSDKVRAIHAYQELGTYTVTLTVTDAEGNTASTSMTVEVRERASLAKLEVTVVDDRGVPVSGAPVYFDMDSAEPVIKYADANGRVTFTNAAGTYIVGAYMDGYLPVTKQVILSGSTTRTVELIMVEQPIVTGEFEVKRMTLEEIIAAGIDVNDPANQHCVSVTVQLSYGEQNVDMDFVRNNHGQVVFGENTTVIGDRQFTALILPEFDAWNYGGGPGGGGSGGGGVGGGQAQPQPKVVVVLETPVSATFLKEFFDVKLHIMNNATEEFSLVDNVIQLNVPDGMTLMEESQNAANETRGELKGQEQWTLSWIIRGDTEGDYNLTADYSSVLEQFNADVNATFESPEIHVYGTSAVHLVMNLNRSIQYQACYIDFGIKNVTDVDLYMPSIGITDALVRAMQDTESEFESVMADTEVISSWVENDLGYTEYVNEDPEVLTGGETLFHRYAIYGVSDDNTILYLNNITLSNLKNIGLDQIEVYVNNFDLYPDDGENAERIMENAKGPCANEFRFLTNPDNYLYFRNGYNDENSILYHIGSGSKDILDVCLTFNFDCFTNNTNRQFFRGIVAELMTDEMLADYVSTKMNSTYAEMTADILSTVAGILKTVNKNVEEIDGAFAEIMQDDGAVAGMSMLLQKQGWGENFQERLIEIVLETGIANVTYESLWQILQDPQFPVQINTKFAEKLGDVGDWFDFGAKLANGWVDAVDAANVLLTLKFAEEESGYFLRTLMKQLKAQGEAGSWMYDEAEAMLEELESSNKDTRDTMVRVLNSKVGQAVAEFGAEKLAQHVAKVTGEYLVSTFGFSVSTITSLSGVYKILQVVYRLADYAFNMSDFYDRSEQMIAMMTMNAIFTEEMNGSSTAVDKVHALKYIIKTNLAGEGVYVDFVKADKDRQEKFEEVNGFDIVYYQEAINRAILSARDRLYNTRTEQHAVPSAPESLTFDYLAGRTGETFTGSYEYSLDGGETWTSCGNGARADHIYVSGKTIAQTLYVRLKATEVSRAGANAILSLTAAPTHRYATAAGVAGDTCMVWGLSPNTTYEILRATEKLPESADWTAAVIGTTDDKGVLTVEAPGIGDYLLYRMPATESAFAAEPHSILLSRELIVQITAAVQGDGEVLCEGEKFTSRILENGQMLTLEVRYDAATTVFKGWFVDGELYSTKEKLEHEAVKSLELTAVFEELDRFNFTVIAGAGGTVTGGGSFYKGEVVTARAFADKGYTFSHWEDASGKIVSINAVRTCILMENVTLKAVFEELPKARIFVSISCQEIEGMERPTVSVVLGGQTVPVTMDRPLEETSGKILQGDTITMKAHSTTDAVFVHWQNEKGTVVSRNAEYTVAVTEYNDYVAVYRVAGQTVTFVGMKGEILNSRQYPVSVSADEIHISSAPAMNGYNFIGWKLGGQSAVYQVNTPAKIVVLQKLIQAQVAAGSDVILNAYYEAIPERYTVTVINGTGSGTYNASHALTIRANAAPNGYNFAGWYENGELISSNVSYSFYVTANRTIEARYSEQPVEAQAVARIETVSSDTVNKKLSFVAMVSVPESCTIMQAGVIATSDAQVGESEDFSVSNAAYVRYGTTSKLNYKYTWTKSKVTDDQTWYVRAYVIFKDANGNSHTVYGDTVRATLNGTED